MTSMGCRSVVTYAGHMNNLVRFGVTDTYMYMILNASTLT